jgi:drug/metabolite transporter (DMT)-like permease
LRGDLLAISTAVFYASYILAMKVLRTHHGALLLMSVGTTTSAVLLFVAAMISDQPLFPSTSLAWLWLVLLAIVPHCLGQGFIVLSLSALPASFAAVTLLLQPVATAVWGWLFLDEPLGPWQIAAGLLVIIGIVLARLGSGGAIQCPPNDYPPPAPNDCGATPPRQPTK